MRDAVGDAVTIASGSRGARNGSLPADESPFPFVPFSSAAVESSLGRRFRAQVAAWPSRPAVRAAGMTVTYEELGWRADRVARGLVASLGDGSEPVALLLPQGVDVVAAVLGVLEAGKLYLGLDSAFPVALLREMVVDAGARVVLSTSELGDLATTVAGSAASILLLDGPDLDGIDAAMTLPEIEPDRLAYLFYTSGSTGRPKGVTDSHRSVLHNIMRYTNTLRISPSDRMTLLQSASFSGSVSSLFGAVLNGACSLPLDAHAASPATLARRLVEERVTIYHSVPAIFRSIFAQGEAFPDLRIVRLEGDQAAKADVRLFASRAKSTARLVNGLGTTETGLVRQFFISPADEPSGAVLPVGYPVPEMEVTVVDDAREHVPDGTIGEIAVRSRFLAVGYWRDPERTAQRFYPDADDPAMRTYLTGDLGRMRADGCLEHLGRIGSRVKVRGHTVELAEVELALLDVQAVREAAVILDDSEPAHPRLVAYWVPAPGSRMTGRKLRVTLEGRLAPHMRPALFVELEALPLTANGKVDRKALPAPWLGRAGLSTAFVAPNNLILRQLAAIWEELLPISPVGVHDDFLELGGDSLAAMALLSRLEADLGVEPSLDWLLSESTISGLAQRILDERPQPPLPVVRVQQGEGGPPLFYLHGDYLSGGYYCRRLAREMGPSVSFVAVTPSGLDGREAAPSFEEMARRHVSAIRTVQPHGPYHLGGTCNGGLLAFEAARILADEGEQIQTLALYAASAANVRYRCLERVGAGVSLVTRDLVPSVAVFRELRRAARSLERKGPVRFLLHALALAAAAPFERLRGLRDAAELPVEPADRMTSLRAHYLRLEDDYVPAAYASKLKLLWPKDEPEPAAQALASWRRICPSAELLELEAGHHACLSSDIELLAQALAAEYKPLKGLCRS